jgi:quercetin dioxygenase-like cupin family protein
MKRAKSHGVSLADLMKWAQQHSKLVIPSAARDLLFRRWSVGLCVIALAITFPLRAQVQEPVPLARGNTPGEPHHHLKIENEYVRAYYVEVPPHEDTQLHQHDHDYIFVTLGDTEVINAVLGKPEVKLSLKDGEVRFTRGGFAHVARNPGDKPFRNVTIELLKPQGEPRNLCAQIVSGASEIHCDSASREKERLRENGISTVPQFQTDEVTVSLTRLAPNSEKTSLTTMSGTLLILLDASGIQKAVRGEPEEKLVVGDVMWLLGGSITTFTNPTRSAWSYLALTFKGSEPLHKY